MFFEGNVFTYRGIIEVSKFAYFLDDLGSKLLGTASKNRRSHLDRIAALTFKIMHRSYLGGCGGAVGRVLSEQPVRHWGIRPGQRVGPDRTRLCNEVVGVARNRGERSCSLLGRNWHVVRCPL